MNLIHIFNTVFDKIYSFSPSLHQDLNQNLIECFNNYIPIHKIPNFLNEEDMDVVTEEICNDKDFEKIDTEIET